MKSHFFTVAVCALSLLASPSIAAPQEEVPREVKAEFRQNVVRRDKLIRELHSVDAKAADAVAAGGKPMAKHADQIALQDQIDLIQLRLETMAMRWTLVIPEPPARDSLSTDESALTAQKVESAFEEGRNRTERVLADRCREMLASIDYDAFLSRSN